ncbi:MAG: NAD(P)H-binding protein [Ignavibacteriales bacterium]
MRNIIILGASGSLAKYVINALKADKDIHLTLFVRNKMRLGNVDTSGCTLIEGDVLDYDSLKNALRGQDVVYGNLSGDLGAMAKNIVMAMHETGVKKLIFISSIGIYDEPVRSVLKPYRAAADIIESSGLDYTILRPTWFTNDNEVDYELTSKGQPEKGSVISRKSIAAFISEIIQSPEKYRRQNLGINKPIS